MLILMEHVCVALTLFECHCSLIKLCSFKTIRITKIIRIHRKTYNICSTYVEYVIWNIISYKKKSMFGTVICLTYFSNSYYLNIFNIRRTIHVLDVCSTYVQYTLPETCVKHALQFSMWMRPEYSFIVVLRAITFYQNLKVYKTVISITYLAVMDENTIKKKNIIPPNLL